MDTKEIIVRLLSKDLILQLIIGVLQDVDMEFALVEDIAVATVVILVDGVVEVSNI